jgi:hypothetical protein
MAKVRKARAKSVAQGTEAQASTFFSAGHPIPFYYVVESSVLAFGSLVFAIGMINTFWGNDPGFGVFILVLSFVYFPPTSMRLNALAEKRLGFPIPAVAKILLGVFILWAALGVGELLDKIELMKKGL